MYNVTITMQDGTKEEHKDQCQYDIWKLLEKADTKLDSAFIQWIKEDKK